MDFPWLTTIGAVPLVGAAAIAVLPNAFKARARHIALFVSLATFVLTLVMAFQFEVGNGGEFQFTEEHAWIPQFGVTYALGVNGLGLVLIALSAVLVPVCVLAAWNEVDADRARSFFALMLVLETSMIAIFAARDLFLFYVVFEAMLIPVYFLIGRFGGPRRSYAAVKFLIYSLAGGLIMLVAVIGLYAAGPGGEQGFM